jgi:hypothetical protein
VEVETFMPVGRTAPIAALLGPGKQTAAQPLRYECRHRFRAYARALQPLTRNVLAYVPVLALYIPLREGILRE